MLHLFPAQTGLCGGETAPWEMERWCLPPKRQYQQLTASVQQPPGRSQSLWGCRPLCSLSLAETPRLADQPAWGEGKTITQARDFAILAASPQVGTLSAPRTHCEVLNKLLATHV